MGHGLNRLIAGFAISVGLMSVGLAYPACAQDAPLTLDEALAIAARSAHPDLARAHATLALAEADVAAVRSDDDTRLALALTGRAVDPAEAASDQSVNDSSAGLGLSKRLYDFGRTRWRIEAAESQREAERWRLQDVQLGYRIEVMRRFFAVILADLDFARKNEAMAVAFVDLDRARDQNELGQVSDVNLAALESAYQARRITRYAADGARRSTRAALAQAMDRPDPLPAELARPELAENDQALPEYETLVAQALKHNGLVKALHAELEGARKALQASRAANRPVLSGTLAATAYERELLARSPLAAEIRLDIPLYQGGRVKAEVARSRAHLDMLEADYQALEYALRQIVLETWQEIQMLKAQREQVTALTEFKLLDFDRARAFYELDLETDFGTALVGQSEAALQEGKTEFALALAWARLARLTGQPLSRVIKAEEKGP